MFNDIFSLMLHLESNQISDWRKSIGFSTSEFALLSKVDVSYESDDKFKLK